MIKQKFDIKNAYRFLAAALRQAFGEKKRYVPEKEKEGGSKKQMTKKGAQHNHRPTYRSGSLMPGITPAMYRRAHLGSKKVRPQNAS